MTQPATASSPHVAAQPSAGTRGLRAALHAWNRWVWGPYMRGTARWPALRSIVPFLPLLALWWFVARAGFFPPAFFPGPGEVVTSFFSLMRKGILPEYLADSATRLAIGAAVGVALGIPLGLLIGLNRHARTALWPILLFFQAIGDIAWLPILLIWFGFGLTTMTFVIVYTVLFPIVLNTVLGVRSIPLDMHRAALSLGASRPRVVWEVVLPGALPNIVTGLRNGLGYGWRALIAAEIIVGTSGIGFLMFDARRAGSVVEIMLGMIVLGVLWYIVDAWILAPIERATGQRWGMVQP
jgi:taurine transport system permease protein